MPQPLKDAAKDLVAKKIDKQTRINRIQQRTTCLFMPKQRADAEGHRRMMCPAEANRGQCSLKPHTLGRGIHGPLTDTPPARPTGRKSETVDIVITMPTVSSVLQGHFRRCPNCARGGI
ncbi:hypothetical protein OG413_11060 [Streptomyces sp. NBC_01433]|uniref:hypothetical protein n=1 Tax=Streptomyces sp. NBC_01433 TaxID=2903864 RepID=UPI00225C4072|nr:hypothetical protein [Streptomyces sp. NBC_01433]MCX4675838.1 hypothetical protein [Streptomyces sp. NBC_01433]